MKLASPPAAAELLREETGRAGIRGPVRSGAFGVEAEKREAKDVRR